MAASLAEKRRNRELEREEEERARRPAAPFKMLTPEEEAAKIMTALGADLGSVELFGNRILVAKFIRDTVGTIGLFAGEPTRREDNYQGKIGLVVKIGTTAFADDKAAGIYWHGDRVTLGDWVLFSWGDGSDLDLCTATGGRVKCKILREGEVAGIVRRPDLFL